MPLFLKNIKVKFLESENEKLPTFSSNLFCRKLIRKIKLTDKY